MQELDKAFSIAASEEISRRALAGFHKQLAAWEIVMPQVDPLVLDFGLDDFHQYGLIEYWICNEVEAGYCGKYLFVFDGQYCPMHRHRHKAETFFVARGTLEVTVDGKVGTLKEGETLFIPPWTPHQFCGVGPALLLEISAPCHVDDNYFEDPRIPIGGNYGGKVLHTATKSS